MAQLTAEHAGEHHSSTGTDNRLLLMWIFLGSETLFFGTLISTYLIYRDSTLPGTPTPDEILNIPLTSTSTFVLLMSSVTMVLAVYGAQVGRAQLMKLNIFATMLLGLVFLGFQAYEFRQFWHEGLTLETNLFGASFFLLTGIHGTHVGVGVLYLGSLLLASFRRNGLGAEAGLNVEIAGLYWHFVDIVWIVIFTIIYLIPS